MFTLDIEQQYTFIIKDFSQYVENSCITFPICFSTQLGEKWEWVTIEKMKEK
jgi:hypothetical protein